MAPKGRGGRGSGAARGRGNGGKRKAADVIPENERPSAEALAEARQIILNAPYNVQRSKEGCYNSWAYKNGIEISQPKADNQEEIIYYTAYMSQKKKT